MRTDAERTQLITQRTAQLRQQAQTRRQRWIDVGCMAACLAFVVYLGTMMPGWVGGPITVPVSPNGTASALNEAGADGYILVGLLSFLLGCCVTILLYRLRRHGEKKHPGDHDEL